MKKIAFILGLTFFVSHVYSQEINESATQQTVVADQGCLTCDVENPEFAVDGDEETFSVINLDLAMANASIAQRLKFPSSACKKEKLVLGLRNPALLEDSALLGLTVATFLHGVSNNDEAPIAMSNVLIDPLNDRVLVVLYPEKEFDEIAIILRAGTAGGMSSLNLYFAKKVLILPEILGVTTVCENNEVNLQLDKPDSKFKYYWYPTSIGGMPIDSGFNFSSVPTASTSIYLARCKDSIGTRKEIAIKLIERPAVPKVDGDLEYCVGDHAALIASGSGNGESFIWNFNGQETTGPVYNSPELSQTSTLFLLSSKDGCRSTDTVKVALAISEKMDAPKVKCEALSPTSVRFFWADNSNAQGYVVGLNGGTMDKSPTKQGSGTSPWEYVVSNLKLDEVIYANVKGLDDSPCQFSEISDVASCQVAKCDTPIFDAPLVVKVCSNEQGEIALEGDDLSKYEFSFGGEPYTSNPIFNFTPVSNTQITVKARYPNAMDCPTKEVKVMVEVLPIPIVAFSASSKIVTVPGGEVKFTNETPGAVDYFWDFGDGQTSTFVNPTIRFLNEMSYDISLTIENSFGCKATTVKPAFIDGQLKASIFIPSAFTPNNDGKNDYFEVIGKRINDFSVSIFNENGKLLFKSLSLGDQWDGSFNFEPQPVGIYYFLVNAKLDDGEELIKKGVLNLIR